jgi:hypothetical protein
MPPIDPRVAFSSEQFMCGIVGAVSTANVVPVLVQGLQRLEYRGYDSCGVAVIQGGALRRTRSTARVAELREQIDQDDVQGLIGIAHTRWATHGAPAVANAHPHFSGDKIALVHNGIIENYEELRTELKAKGYVFESQTDTEVIAHLVHHLYDGDLFEAVQTAKRLKGAYAIAVFCRDEPQRVVGAREGSPLILGLGGAAAGGANYLASTPWPWPASPTRSSTWKTATWWTCSWASTGSWRATPAASSARWSARCAPCTPTAARPSWALTATTCRRRSSSSRAPSPTRSKAWRASPRAVRRRGLPHLQGRRPRAHPGLRHQLLLRLGGQVLAGEHRQDPHQRGDRQRIPLPRQRARPEDPGRHHQPERRDGRHPGRAQARAAWA